MKDYKSTVVIDFNGVIHYKSGLRGQEVIPDPAVPGIREVINELRSKKYWVVAVSALCSTDGGIRAVRAYLAKNGIEVDNVCNENPPAICYVICRTICFRGNARNLVKQIESVRTWLEDSAIQHMDCTEVHMDVGEITQERMAELTRMLEDPHCMIAEMTPCPPVQYGRPLPWLAL